MKNVIWAGPVTPAKTSPQTNEAIAAEDLIPGTLVAKDANGKFAVSSATGTSNAQVMIVRECGIHYQGRQIEDPWKADESAVAIVALSGDFINVRVAASQTIKRDDPLTSNGDGTFKKAGASDKALFYSREDVTTTEVTLVSTIKQ